MMIRVLRALALLPAGLFLLLSCGPPAPAPPTGIRVVIPADPLTLSPVGKNDRASEVIGMQISDSLVRYDSRLRIVPRLAESWSVGADGRKVTFRLRDGVRWQDGEPFGAEDVLRTVAKALEPATEARSHMAQFQRLVSLTAPDRLTVVAVYDQPNPDFLENWTIPMLPAHLVSLEEDLLTSDYAANPVGCGPFRFAGYTPGQSVVLEANEDYWDGMPGLDRIEFRIIPDERTSYQALLTGDVDLLSVTPEVWREALESESAARFKRLTFSGLNVWYLAWNQDPAGPFHDPDTRKAMMLALDRQSFIEAVLHGLARPGITTFHPDSPWADPTLSPRPYDPEQASALLAAAGWQDQDGDGILERDGRPFRFTLLFPRGSQELAPRMAAWMQQSWAALGIAMEAENLEWRAFLEKRNAGNFQAVMATISFSSPSPDQFELYHSTARENGFNFFGMNDPETDRLLEEVRSELDPESRLEAAHRLQRRLFQLEPLGCVFHFASPVLYQPDLTGIDPSPLDLWRHWPGPMNWKRDGSRR